MLFNSYQFLFLFLPLTLAGFFLLGRFSRGLALAWIVVASLVFYAWWRPINVPIIAVSLLVNFTIARLMQRLESEPERARLRSTLLVLGIAFNVAFLAYFKYTNFILTVAHDLTGTDFVLRNVVLPLGISFITFQKIAFLVDVHAGRIESFRLRDYLLFVLFFPQLIAGPIVHYREMMPQFHASTGRFDSQQVAAGLTLMFIGLFKKVVLADGIAAYVTPVYELAAGSGSVSLLPAWLAALGFTLQIYFDFSGYSDMAAGLARCFGVRLPLNFYSPLQASSIIDFWSRWHVTLTRFLTAYLYNPMLLWLTRRRLKKGRPALGSHNASVGAFLQLLAGPTLLTMFVSGIWHGAGYLFVLWGLLHGVYLVVNHAWRFTGAKLWSDKAAYDRLMRPVGFVLTFFAVIVAMVLFRAPNTVAAGGVLKGMIGANGIEVPQMLAAKLVHLGLPHHAVTALHGVATKEFAIQYIWLFGLLGIALLLPNSLQFMSRYEPVLGIKERPAITGVFLRGLRWSPTLLWAVLIATLAAIAVFRVGGPSEFLYWQF